MKGLLEIRMTSKIH